MATEKVNEMSNEVLLKNEAKAKAIVIAFSIVLSMLLVAIIVLMMKKGFSALIATPMGLLPILIIIINNWNAMKKEIESRNLR